MPIYVYCIILEKNFRINEISGTKIYSIPCKDIAAVASNTDKLELQLTEENMEKHIKILQVVMEKHTVVPMAFGMIFKNKEILEAVLYKSYNEIKEALSKLENKIELGVKVIANGNVKEKSLEKFGEEFREELTSKAVSVVRGRRFSEKLLLNLSFLIEKDALRGFSAAIAKLEKKYPNLKFNYSGPWPPYSFVNIKIQP